MSVQEDNLRAIADAIREKEGSGEPIPAKDFPERIRGLQGGGIELSSIEITAPPAKVSYLAGERFDPAGMVVTAAYSNGATLAATGYAVEPSGPLEDGMEAVTVRYTEGGVSAAASVAITVIHRLTGISIETPPAKTEYRAGEVFDPAGMVVLAAYSDGASEAATGYTVPTEAFAAPGPQEVAVTYTEHGVTASASVAVTVARLVIEAIPRQSGSPTYTGEAITLELENYDPAQLTLGGVTSAVNAGEYAATATPTESWRWSDGTTGAKSIVWTIGKAAGSVSLSPASVKLDKDHLTAEIQVTRAGDGAVSAASSDTGVVTVSVSGTAVTVSSVGEASGSATVTVTVAEGPNHLAASGTAAVTASFVMIYGVEWDGSASTKLSRTDAAALFVDPVAAVGDGAGSSPFDDLMPWSGMVRVTDAQAGELVSIPKYWLKVQHFPFRVQIADGPVDGYQVSPAHRDREDGQGERDVVYIGRYPCSNSYQSVSGVNPEWLKTLSVYRDNIHALGEEYWQSDYALQLTWWFLYIVEYADWNGELRIGIGHSKLNDNLKTGGTDSMSYHTGRASGTDGYVPIQYRYIEDIWGGNNKELRDGIIFSLTEKKFCTYNNPANFSNEYGATGAAIRNIPAPPETSGIISAWGYDQDDPSFIYPSEVVELSGNTGTYIADAYTTGSNGAAIAVGLYEGFSGYSGPFFIDKRYKVQV